MKRKHINFPVTEEEHKALKIMAAKQGTTVKQILFKALDRINPNWRKEAEGLQEDETSEV